MAWVKDNLNEASEILSVCLCMIADLRLTKDERREGYMR